MLQETLALLLSVPALGLLWVSAGSQPPLVAPYPLPRIAGPILREDDDDLDEEEDEEEEEELEEEELEQELEEEEEEDEAEEEDEM